MGGVSLCCVGSGQENHWKVLPLRKSPHYVGSRHAASCGTKGVAASASVSPIGSRGGPSCSPKVYRCGSGDHMIEFCRRVHASLGAGGVGPCASGGGDWS
eukprot:CAMPEP_0185315826 /NCGR_PEP_ID=MMETSP1363-20130426/42405_1 /TAXON_ID=38817 /ORGANISM="Gephyrocapsa oceanica, Strain RCC1303" /LENGTH=99 /DNA_ID=CAMNT_0027913949 /DNA_START=9 /DNA_END=308 /DNA_ORIENTATION=-